MVIRIMPEKSQQTKEAQNILEKWARERTLKHHKERRSREYCKNLGEDLFWDICFTKCYFYVLRFHASPLCNSSPRGIFCRVGCRSSLRSETCLSSVLCNGENEGCPRGGVERGETMLARRVCGAELGTSISSVSMTLRMSMGPWNRQAALQGGS